MFEFRVFTSFVGWILAAQTDSWRQFCGKILTEISIDIRYLAFLLVLFRIMQKEFGMETENEEIFCVVIDLSRFPDIESLISA